MGMTCDDKHREGNYALCSCKWGNTKVKHHKLRESPEANSCSETLREPGPVWILTSYFCCYFKQYFVVVIQENIKGIVIFFPKCCNVAAMEFIKDPEHYILEARQAQKKTGYEKIKTTQLLEFKKLLLIFVFQFGPPILFFLMIAINAYSGIQINFFFLSGSNQWMCVIWNSLKFLNYGIMINTQLAGHQIMLYPAVWTNRCLSW